MLTWNLSCDRTANLCLGIFQKLYKSGYKVAVDHLLVDGFGNLPHVSPSHVPDASRPYLLKSICHHVAHSPALVLE
jgi:hypothetical protein